MPKQTTPLTKTRIFGTADRAALYLKTFATACREEGDEETAMVVEAAADEIERLRRGGGDMVTKRYAPARKMLLDRLDVEQQVERT